MGIGGRHAPQAVFTNRDVASSYTSILPATITRPRYRTLLVQARRGTRPQLRAKSEPYHLFTFIPLGMKNRPHAVSHEHLSTPLFNFRGLGIKWNREIPRGQILQNLLPNYLIEPTQTTKSFALRDVIENSLSVHASCTDKRVAGYRGTVNFDPQLIESKG